MKKTINGITFDQVGFGWAADIGKKTIVVGRGQTGWEAKIVKSTKGGSYMDGTKKIICLAEATGKTMAEAIDKVMV